MWYCQHGGPVLGKTWWSLRIWISSRGLLKNSTVPQTSTRGKTVPGAHDLAGLAAVLPSAALGCTAPLARGGWDSSRAEHPVGALPVLGTHLPPPPRFLLHSQVRALGQAVNGNLEGASGKGNCCDAFSLFPLLPQSSVLIQTSGQGSGS